MDAASERELERVVRDGVLSALENLVRVGTVTWTDPARRLARVKFQDTGLSSGELSVLAARPGLPEQEGPQYTQSAAGGEGEAAFAEHRHALRATPWMPRVNAAVLCLYLPVWNGDGFILGELGPGRDQTAEGS